MPRTLDELAQQARTLEVQAAYRDNGWHATVQTYQHGSEARDPGDQTGIGRGAGDTFDDALSTAVTDWQSKDSV